MNHRNTWTRAARGVALVRLVLGIATIGILIWIYLAGIPRQGANPFDYFGYFTNLTSLLAGAVLIATALRVLRGQALTTALIHARGIAVVCMLVVATIYNLIVPGTDSAPVWVSIVLHGVLPALLVADWMLAGDRPPLAWRTLWLVLPYPVTWLAVVLVRGRTDGWVPYGFLLPDRALPPLLLTVAALLGCLLLFGAFVWATSRIRGIPVSLGSAPAQSAVAQP